MRRFCRAALPVLCALLVGHAGAQPRHEPTERVPDALSQIERALERGARAAAAGVERGLQAAEQGVRAGAAAAARGVQRGAHATARAAERVARELERRLPAYPPPGSERTDGGSRHAGPGRSDA